MQDTVQVYPFSYVFVIFFLTLGPLKVIPIFNRLCYKTEPNFAKKLALKATIISSIILFAVAIIGKGILAKWDVSTAALFVAGGLLILMASLQMLSNFSLRHWYRLARSYKRCNTRGSTNQANLE